MYTLLSPWPREVWAGVGSEVVVWGRPTPIEQGLQEPDPPPPPPAPAPAQAPAPAAWT